jgi:RNA polymerase sigma factor (sigma-70 family)
MAHVQLGTFLRHLRGLLRARLNEEQTDSALLERFVSQRDEAAFASLMQRHGPMVLGVCQRVLDDPHDADDAFQATFLVLIRKAVTIRKRGSLGSWLYGAAYRIACKARVLAAKRRRHERQVPTMRTTEPSEAFLWRELRPVLDEELNRLPEKLRAPLVLCYLEGKTQEEAARQLGWTKGTVSGRMAQGRELLRSRLTRRGLTLTGGLLATVLAEKVVAEVPATLLTATGRAALSLITGEVAAASVISHQVHTLMEGAVQAMFLTKLKAAMIVLVALGVAASSGILLLRQPLTASAGPGENEAKENGSAEPTAKPPLADAKLLRATLEGPNGWVAGLAFAPDGKTLVAAGGPSGKAGEGVLWDISGTVPRERAKLQGHPWQVMRVEFAPDGSSFVTVGGDGTIKIWKADTGREQATLPFKAGLPAGASARDGKTLAVRRGSDLHFLDLTDGGFKETASLKGPSKDDRPAAISPDGKLIAYSNDEDGTLTLRERATGREIASIVHGFPNFLLVFSPDSKLFVTGGLTLADERGGVTLWEIATKRGKYTFQGGKAASRAAFSPNGKILAMGNGDGSVYLWDVASGQGRGTFQAHTGPVVSLAFAPDGATLATGSRDEPVKLWNMAVLQSGNSLPAVKGNPEQRLADTWQLWAKVQVKHTDPILTATDMLTSLAISPDGKSFAATNQNRLVKLWRLTENSVKEWATFESAAGYLYAVAYSPDAKTLAAAGGEPQRQGEIKLWDLTGELPKERATLHGHRTSINCLAFAPDGKTLATGDGHGTLKLWDVATGRETVTLQRHLMPIHALAFSPDGKLLATASQDKTAKLWDLAKERDRATLHGHTGWVLSVAFSPDGERLVTGSQDTTAKVWNTASGKEMATLKGHGNYINSVVYSPDGRTIATGCADTVVRLWNAKTYEFQQQLWNRGNQRIERVAYSSTGGLFAIGYLDGTVKLWEIRQPPTSP